MSRELDRRLSEVFDIVFTSVADSEIRLRHLAVDTDVPGHLPTAVVDPTFLAKIAETQPELKLCLARLEKLHLMIEGDDVAFSGQMSSSLTALLRDTASLSSLSLASWPVLNLSPVLSDYGQSQLRILHLKWASCEGDLLANFLSISGLHLEQLNLIGVNLDSGHVSQWDSVSRTIRDQVEVQIFEARDLGSLDDYGHYYDFPGEEGYVSFDLGATYADINPLLSRCLNRKESKKRL